MKKTCWYWIRCILLSMVVLVGCSSPSTSTSTSPLPSSDLATSALPTPVSEPSTDVWPAGKILYHADAVSPTFFQIYKVVNGGDPTRLSPDDSVDLGARWSRDGEMIVFASYVDAMRTNEHIFTMAADGGERTVLPVEQPRLNWRPSLSPDGTQVVFISNRDVNFEIYKANLDGSSLVNITNMPNSNERDPEWSPDGGRIVLVSDMSGVNDLYVMDADGGNFQPLLEGVGDCSYPSWSPDGNEIAFTMRVQGTYHIYTVNADGSGLSKITSRVPDNVMPSWVGNDRLLFSGSDGGDIWNLFIVNVDGTGLVQLTDTPYSERYPQWYP